MIEEAQISVIEKDNSVIITGSGILDFTNSERLKYTLKCAATEADAVIVDFRAADFIDTAIIQYLAKAAMTLINRSKRLQVIVSESGYPLQVFQISGFGKIIDITIEPDQN